MQAIQSKAKARSLAEQSSDLRVRRKNLQAHNNPPHYVRTPEVKLQSSHKQTTHPRNNPKKEGTAKMLNQSRNFALIIAHPKVYRAPDLHRFFVKCATGTAIFKMGVVDVVG